MRIEPARALRLVRGLVLAFALLGLAWLASRVELLRLPRDGCSPVHRFAPGSLLLLDRRPSALHPGDVLFFEARDPLAGEGSAPRVHLGRLVEERTGAAGLELWIEAEREACPGLDSRALGWIPREALRARALLALPW